MHVTFPWRTCAAFATLAGAAALASTPAFAAGSSPERPTASGASAARAAHDPHGSPTTQYVFTSGYLSGNPVIFVYSTSGNPNVPVATLTKDLGTAIQIGGVDSQGNLYVTAFESDGLPHIVVFPQPYGSSDTVGPGPESVGAVQNDGALSGTGPLGLAVYPAGSFTPALQWPGVSAVYLNPQAFDQQGDLYTSVFSYDSLWYGIVRYPPGSTQGEDLHLPFVSSSAVVGLAIDGAGRLVVSQQGTPQVPPTLKIFAPEKTFPPGEPQPKRTIQLSFTALGLAFDANFRHVFLSSNAGGVYEYTYPAFKLVASFGTSPPTGGIGAAVYPPAHL